ncbi:MAG: glycosyltransferase [bacterium]|nr:glycosyltransferase [bacterium]
MKILHIVPSYLPAYRYGGPIISVHALNKWLVRGGVAVTVFTTNADGPNRLNVVLNQEIDIDGVKVWYFPVSFPARWMYSSALRRALKERTGEFDLVHVTSVFLAASTLAASAARRAGKPYIISPRGSLMCEPLGMKSALKKRLYLALIERRNLAHAAAIHFTSETEREEYAGAGFPLRRAFVIPNGLDTEGWPPAAPGDFRSKWKISLDRRIVLAMGRIGWKKGFDTLIPALARVAKKDPRVLLVISGSGDEGYKKNVQLLLSNYQLQKSILFTGPFEGMNVPALTDADVFVLPSYSENFGMAVIQAMYAGLPVVVTPGVALSREVADSGAGLVVEKDEAAVAGAILKVLGNRTVAHDMGVRGKSLVEKSFLAPKVAHAFREAYTELVRLA